jgi:hypothetical protein
MVKVYNQPEEFCPGSSNPAQLVRVIPQFPGKQIKQILMDVSPKSDVQSHWYVKIFQSESGNMYSANPANMIQKLLVPFTL